jgi:hypothetical protein
MEPGFPVQEIDVRRVDAALQQDLDGSARLRPVDQRSDDPVDRIRYELVCLVFFWRHADTITLRDLYKKHHWQVAGPTFYQLHLLFDKHADEQSKLVDAIAERVQLLGGVSIAMAHDVAETTLIPRPPKGREPAPVQVSRLLHAHEQSETRGRLPGAATRGPALLKEAPRRRYRQAAEPIMRKWRHSRARRQMVTATAALTPR